MKYRFLWYAQLMLVAALMLPISAHAEGQRTMLVLDASGSMWGQIDGKPKIEIAREAVAEVIKNWNLGDDIGLIAYGHRKKGDCDDIETLIPAGKLDVAKFNAAVRKLNPKGKTPLTAAVKQAAEQLRYTEDKATVILISDGRETCNADPCAVATKLEKAGVDFTAHVIGFDVAGKKGIAELQCLAKNTGGEYLTAKNAEELKSALRKTVKKVAAKPVGHQFYVSLGKASKPLKNISNYWYLYRVDTGGKRTKVTHNGQANPLFANLKKGRYLAVVKHGYAHAKIEFESQGLEDSATHYLSLEAGLAHLKVAMAKGQPPLASISNYWYIYRVDADGKRTKVTQPGQSQPTLVLPEGKYHARVQHGYGSAEGDFEVKINQTSELSLILNEGLAHLKVAMAKGQPPLASISNYWYIYRVDADGKRTKVTQPGQSQPTLVLPEGKYHARVQHGYGSAEGDFEVKINQTSELSLILNEGLAHLKVAMAKGQPPLASISNYWYIYRVDADGKRTKVTQPGQSQPTLVLPEGKYHALVKHKQFSAEGDFHIKTGASTDLMLILRPAN